MIDNLHQRVDTTGADDGLSAGRQAYLQIYVSEHCNSCEFAIGVAELIGARYPHVTVEIVDVGIYPEKQPDAVFATPTYVLNGRIWSLGNPSEEMIDNAFSTDG